MTFDELDSQILSIKRQGLTPYVERHKIAQVRQKYYIEKINKEKEKCTELFLKNIQFLNKLHKSRCNRYNVEENMGILPDDYFQFLLDGSMNIYNFEHILICAAFFGIPSELILFTDLQANEETIRKEYPALFQQSRH